MSAIIVNQQAQQSSDFTATVDLVAAPMVLKTTLTSYNDGKTAIAGKGAVDIPFAARTDCEIDVRVYLQTDGRYWIDEYVQDGVHLPGIPPDDAVLMCSFVIITGATSITQEVA